MPKSKAPPGGRRLQMTCDRLSVAGDHRARTPFVVQADAQDVVGDIGADPRTDRRRGGESDLRVERAEVQIDVLDLARPIAGEARLKADANGPSGIAVMIGEQH